MQELPILELASPFLLGIDGLCSSTMENEIYIRLSAEVTVQDSTFSAQLSYPLLVNEVFLLCCVLGIRTGTTSATGAIPSPRTSERPSQRSSSCRKCCTTWPLYLTATLCCQASLNVARSPTPNLHWPVTRAVQSHGWDPYLDCIHFYQQET